MCSSDLIQPIIKSLIDNKAVLSLEELNEKFTPKTQVFVRFSDEFDSEEQLEKLIAELDGIKSKSKQLDAILCVLRHVELEKEEQDVVLRKTLLEEGISQSSINTQIGRAHV